MTTNDIDSLLIITPVKDSIVTTEQTIRSVMASKTTADWHYVVYDDFSTVECSDRLDCLALELGFEVVHLRNITATPSPNYRLVLQTAQRRAIATRSHLIILESDVEVTLDSVDRLFQKANSTSKAGMVAAVTVDESEAVNFPYLYARRWSKKDRATRKRFSFCFTLLTNVFLQAFDFATLDPEKQWYDVTISHESIKRGFTNTLMMTNPVVHRPHSSRPWKLLKYTNPLRYYWIKYTRGLDKI